LHGSKFFEKCEDPQTWTLNIDKAELWEVEELKKIDEKLKSHNIYMKSNKHHGNLLPSSRAVLNCMSYLDPNDYLLNKDGFSNKFKEEEIDSSNMSDS
jgi:hypothetical protein